MNDKHSARISLDSKGTPPGEDKLMAYVHGKLLPEEQYAVEQWLNEEGLESDAIEGLQLLSTPEAKHSVQKLNTALNKTLRSKKRRPRSAKPDQTILIAVALILLLAVVAYIVIRIAGHQ